MKKIDVTQPYAMSSPFAEGVYSSVSTNDFEIPANTSTAQDDTCVIDDGFLPITSTDLDDGGIAPERKNFNGMFYLSTDQRFYLQNGGFITYNSNVATAIGGYPQDAVLGYIDGQGTYKLVRSLIDDNTNDFTQDETLIDGEHWEEIAMGGGGSGYQMFDIVMKDHVLSYAETLGLAPLGTYVYKEAIAGSRYGYPDFYAKCVEEYTAGTTVNAYMSSNINVVGSLTDNDGVISGFSTSNYATLPNQFNVGTNNWEFVIKFKSSDVTTLQTLIGGVNEDYAPFEIQIENGKLKLWVSEVDTTSFIAGVLSDTTFNANTDYWIKTVFNGTSYVVSYSPDGTTYTNTISVTSSKYAFSDYLCFGLDKYANNTVFAGSIDLNGCYIDIDGTRWWTGTNILTYKEADNKHRFYDIADKATFDNMYAITGEAWYYGVDTTNERVFLPRSTRFKNGTSSDVGQYQEAGLPDITGNIKGLKPNLNGSITADGCFSSEVDFAGGSESRYGQNIYKVNMDASRSSSIYGNSTTVEYSSTKLIPYMVVGNQSTWSGMTDVVNQGMTILSQVNAGLATKVDLDGSNATFPHITETYENGTSGYIVYSNGYCEQWGFSYAPQTITLLKPFIDTNYIGITSSGTSNIGTVGGIINKTTTTFDIYLNGGSGTTYYMYWRVCGYIS